MDGKELEFDGLTYDLAHCIIIAARHDGDAAAYCAEDAEVTDRTWALLGVVCDMLTGAAPLDAVAVADTLQALHAEILQGTGKA